MKKVLLAGAIALFGAANAQTEKGSWVVSGSTGIGFNNISTKAKANGVSANGPKVSTLSITPSVGYFVTNGLAIGLDLGFTSATSKEDGDKSTTSTFSIIPSATYYFKGAGQVLPYLGAGVGYSSINNKYNSGTYSQDSDTSGLAWKVKGGIVYMITPTVGIDLGVGYNQFSSKETMYGVKVTNTVGTLGVNGGLSVFFK